MFKLIKSRADIFILFAIIVVGFLARFLFLDISPARLTADELSIGYNAYSIIMTGKDEWGRTFPLVFEAFGDFKLPAYIYASMPFIALGGLNFVTVKLVSVISGTFLILAIYLITKELTRNKLAAYLSALITALSPWTIHLSRSGLESNLALVIFAFGLWILLKLLNPPKIPLKKSLYYAVIVGLAFGFTWYAYIAYRVTTILLLGFIALMFFKTKSLRRPLALLAITFALTITPLLAQALGDSGTARFKQISVFSDEGVAASVNENRSFCYLVDKTVLPKFCQVLFHKPQVISGRVAVSYASFLSPTFLFIEGDEHEYLNLPGYGEFYLFLAPFYIIGLVAIILKKSPSFRIITATFLVAPIPSSLAGDPQIVRGSMLIIPVVVMIAIGIHKLFKELPKPSHKFIFSIVLLILFSASFIKYFTTSVVIYPTKYDNAAYPAPNELASYIYENETDYDYIYINNDGFHDFYIYLAFLNRIDPDYLQKNVARPQADTIGFIHPIALGKYRFISERLESHVCNPDSHNILFIADHSEDSPVAQQFHNYAGVHVQAQAIDLEKHRAYLRSKSLLATTCPLWTIEQLEAYDK